MASFAPPLRDDQHYRLILGVRFFVGDAPSAVRVGSRGGLMVAPAAPALLELERDETYREALLGADLAVTDSGFLVLMWNLIAADSICRVSGLEYLKLLLGRPEFKEHGSTLWVMPSADSRDRNLRWLRDHGYPFEETDCYLAPKYSAGAVQDEALVKLLNERRPQHVIICIGGGIQEKLGLHVKRHCPSKPAIHCIGAAIGFLSGDQVRIPDWADQKVLGWFFRCLSDPKRFVPRYARALSLAGMLWRYRGRLPEMTTRLSSSRPSPLANS
jgi:UDP-N-acetyl-D-mannosaminuronic acid transferase (WecB/TagA/CpsF family)